MLRKARAKKTAQALLQQLNIKKAPVKIESIIKQLSKTNFEQLNDIHYKVTKEVFPNELGDVSAILLKEKGQAVIAVNAEHSESRQRFSIAHELGHLILHSNNEQLTIEKKLFTRAEGVRNLDETEANEFAAELLMPEELLEKDFEKISEKNEDELISILAIKYQVSQLAVSYRLKNLNLV